MSAVVALILIIFSALAFSIVLNRNAAEMLPFTIFTIILYLYSFYCADFLVGGIVSLHLGIIFLLSYAIVFSIKKKVNVLERITPAFVVFCCTAFFFYLYTNDNYSLRWDELRLWSAMPKAIYETKQLQLGAQSLIFNVPGFNMQTYPPALPLFTNFFLTHASSFSESYIFLAYAIFVSAITTTTFQHLSWKHWWCIPLASIFVIYAPILLTMHGGDHSYFYESLFIDPVLGFAAGYVFFLATSKPFQSKFSCIHFSFSLAVLTIIKDSGIMFALFSLLCALSIRKFDEQVTFKSIIREGILPLCTLFLSYFSWKALLLFFNSHNQLSLHSGLPSLRLIQILIDVVFHAPILPLRIINFSFAGYTLMLLGGCILIEILTKSHSKASNVFSFIYFLLISLSFALGYLMVFPGIGSYEHMLSLSYERYFTTLTAAYFIFCSMRYFPTICEIILPNRKLIKISILILSVLFFLRYGSTLTAWELDYTEQLRKYILPAQSEKEKILQQIPVDDSTGPKQIYLLMAKNEPNKLHHRIYFDLLGSGVNIKNFYVDTDMHFGTGTPPYSVEETAEKWYARLLAEGYDYIYVCNINETTNQAFSHLNLGEAIPGHIYPVT